MQSRSALATDASANFVTFKLLQGSHEARVLQPVSYGCFGEIASEEFKLRNQV